MNVSGMPPAMPEVGQAGGVDPFFQVMARRRFPQPQMTRPNMPMRNRMVPGVQPRPDIPIPRMAPGLQPANGPRLSPGLQAPPPDTGASLPATMTPEFMEARKRRLAAAASLDPGRI